MVSRVVAVDEPVVVATCSTCGGTALFCIARYMDASDLAQMGKLVRNGYKKEVGTLNRFKSDKGCSCKKLVDEKDWEESSPKIKPKPTGKSTLSLKSG